MPRYESSTGGCTKLSNGSSGSCSPQSSGAYIFRPATQALHLVAAGQQPTTQIVRGTVVTEVRQSFSNWATHVIRLYDGSSSVEVEWTAGECSEPAQIPLLH